MRVWWLLGVFFRPCTCTIFAFIYVNYCIIMPMFDASDTRTWHRPLYALRSVHLEIDMITIGDASLILAILGGS